MAVSNKKNANILLIKKVEAEEILCAPTVCTIPVVWSFTLMLEEPKETITQRYETYSNMHHYQQI